MSFNDEYAAARKQADEFEGMMAPASIAIFQSLLSFQRDEGIAGDMCEFGVYRGRSASVLLRNLHEGEALHLVDKAEYPEFDKLSKISRNYTFTQGKSEELLASEEFLRAFPKSVRFSHHDASHAYVNVTAEMKAMAHRIAPRGVMALDDFGNPCYMQVIAACFAYLTSAASPIELFLFSSNKAYLCRKEDFDYFHNYLINRLMPEINGAGHNFYLGRTEVDPRYRGFSLVQKSNPNQPDFYGRPQRHAHLYGVPEARDAEKSMEMM